MLTVFLDRVFRDRVSTELGPDVRVKPTAKILSRANG